MTAKNSRTKGASGFGQTRPAPNHVWRSKDRRIEGLGGVIKTLQKVLKMPGLNDSEINDIIRATNIVRVEYRKNEQS